ncbi:MAG: EamA family transporter [Gaiellaceae bacterium]
MSPSARLWTALFTIYVIWGSTYLAIALAVETMSPTFAVSTRYVVAGVLLAAWLVWRSGWHALVVTRMELASVAIVAVLLIGANVLLFYAERTVPTSLASLIIASVPLIVAALRIAAGDRPPATVLVGIAAGFAGIAVLVRPTVDADVTGIALVVGSALAWAIGSFLSPRLPLPRSSLTVTTLQMLIGGLIFLPLGLASAPEPGEVSARSLAGWAYLVVFGALVGYTAYVWLLAHAPIGLVATYAYVNPVVAIALGTAVLDESLTTAMVIGATIVLTSVAVVVRREPPVAEPVPLVTTIDR